MKKAVPKQPAAKKTSRRARPKVAYVLRLFVAGATARSHRAVLRVRELCAAEPKGSCRLEVIDIYQQPALARTHQIVATPTLFREYPRPIRRFIGSLQHTVGLFGGPLPLCRG